MDICEIYFSPTGGTKRVVDCLAEGILSAGGQESRGIAADGEESGGNPKPREVDLSDARLDFESFRFREGELCVIGVPSYGGRVPAVAIQRIGRMSGGGATAVIAAVYGNRAYDDTLLELKETAEAAGFRAICAVAAVAEHSIAREYGAGRPDEKDREELHAFARKIQGKLAGEERDLGADGKQELAVPGKKPFREYGGVPVKPVGGKGCTRCGLCAARCPVGAIPRENPAKVDKKICISCMRCVAVCPEGARKANPVLLFGAKQMLKKVCAGRKKNELFL